MSHMVYPNLAEVEGFSRDLNYTGVIAEGWDDPLNLAFLTLLALCLACGLPGSSFHAWWALLNAAIIHPMDLIVGTLGRGPKYLSDEYAVMDTRYWPLDDPAISCISYVEVIFMVPLCYFWYKAIVQGKWYRHYCALQVSTLQIMGCIIYMYAEWHQGFRHLPAPDWPSMSFDSRLKLKYFWLIFVGCNLVWVVIPLYVMVYTFTELRALGQGKEKRH